MATQPSTTPTLPDMLATIKFAMHIESSAYVEKMLPFIEQNLIPLDKVKAAAVVSITGLARAMATMQGIIVLTRVIHVELLQIEDGWLEDIREKAATTISLALDLVATRSGPALAKFTSKYWEVLTDMEYVLDLFNMNLAYRFGELLKKSGI